jgi:hypothetical protein
LLPMLNVGPSCARSVLGAVLSFGATVSTVSAQWAVINLHPEGPFDSYAVSVQDGQQVGYVRMPGTFLEHASVWSGSAASWVDLHPLGATQSRASSVSNGLQFGWACCFDPPSPGSVVHHAMMWSGTADSWSDLSPAGMFGEVNGSAAGQQVGTSNSATWTHAGLWSGSAGSWVDLHPASTSFSVGLDTDGTQQVGYALDDGNTRASLWTGSAASWVNLHPSAALASRAIAVHGGQQVGWGMYPLARRAHLWKGTKNSLVNLHPAGAAESWASGVHAGQQVGTVTLPTGGWHASFWGGTAASWVDLHSFLPPEYNSLSEAFDIWHSGNTTYVVGNAYNSATGRYEALMWVSPPPAPVWTHLGSALAGVAGLPQLSGTGTLVAGDPMSLSLVNAAPSASTLLFVAVSSTPTPFKGGTLVPVPPLTALPFATSASGSIQIPVAAWPPGASGLDLFIQYAIQDASAVKGVALSNALHADVP